MIGTPMGWDDPAVPGQQHALASAQVAGWLAGQRFEPFDAWAACAQRIVFTRPQPSIVDLGCGAGHWLELFRARWPDCWIVGVDASAPMVAFAQRTYGHRGRVSYVQGDQRSLPFLADGAADLVHHGCCLIHLPPSEWAAALTEAARVIHPYGYVLVHKTPIARHREKAWLHAAYGTQIREHCARWDTFADAYQAAGLEMVWEERWDETGDPCHVTALFRRRAR